MALIDQCMNATSTKSAVKSKTETFSRQYYLSHAQMGAHQQLTLDLGLGFFIAQGPIVIYTG